MLCFVYGIVCKDWLVCFFKNIVIYIVLFFDLVDIVRFGLVCRLLYKVCLSDELWEKIFFLYCDIIIDEI